MGTWTLAGPVIDKDNMVLKSARLVSESDRARNGSDSHRLRVGIREGQYVSFIGTWDQASNKLTKGKQRGLLSSARANMRLRAGTQIIVEARALGSPATPADMAVTLRLALDGARTGALRPLVRAGPASLLAAQINDSGLSEFDVRIQVTEEPS